MISLARIEHSSAIARLHAETLTTSFLASLGNNFLSKLYAFLITKEKVWIYEEANEIKGFVCFSANSSGTMKRFLINCPHCIILLAMKTITHPVYLKRFTETFTAPFKSKKTKSGNRSINLPLGELLSISVSPNCQAVGIGGQLVNALEEYLIHKNISQYKVIVGEELIGANKFYKKNGFILATQIKIHGEKRSNVYVKNIIQ